jgi:hypothetical protein
MTMETYFFLDHGAVFYQSNHTAGRHEHSKEMQMYVFLGYWINKMTNVGEKMGTLFLFSLLLLTGETDGSRPPSVLSCSIACIS